MRETLSKLDKANLGIRNRGWLFERTEQPNGDLEKAFAEEWAKQNSKTSILLHCLFQSRRGWGVVHAVSAIEMFVVATVIQWLGTNVGFSFLQRALRRCGMAVVVVEERKVPTHICIEKIQDTTPKPTLLGSRKILDTPKTNDSPKDDLVLR